MFHITQLSSLFIIKKNTAFNDKEYASLICFEHHKSYFRIESLFLWWKVFIIVSNEEWNRFLTVEMIKVISNYVALTSQSFNVVLRHGYHWYTNLFLDCFVLPWLMINTHNLCSRNLNKNQQTIYNVIDQFSGWIVNNPKDDWACTRKPSVCVEKVKFYIN